MLLWQTSDDNDDWEKLKFINTILLWYIWSIYCIVAFSSCLNKQLHAHASAFNPEHVEEKLYYDVFKVIKPKIIMKHFKISSKKKTLREDRFCIMMEDD